MVRSTTLRPDFVRRGLVVSSWREALLALVRALHSNGKIRVAEEPYARLLEREAAGSTALGGGIALPHARSTASPEARLAVALLEPAVDFNAADGIPVDLVFLLLGPPEAPGEHVKLLARIARLAQRASVLEELRAARADAEFREVLEREL
jgi:nitrogen PTS system EIIA component